jgi:rhamnogalacturonan endolyase
VQLNMKEVRRLTTGLYSGQVEHKYDYSAVQFEIPAYGWSSTEHHVGLWFVNPSIEYLSGGPTKVELTGHLDVNAGAAPTVLNYWRGSHYGGSSCRIAKGEAWTKVIGPFLIYCNSAPDHDQMWKDALARAAKEAAAWPYDWIAGVDYPGKNQRGSVTGTITVKDPQAPMLQVRNWEERTVPFDATLLKAGTNVLKLTNTGRNWTEGVLYDYLRLELDESAREPAPPAKDG